MLHEEGGGWIEYLMKQGVEYFIREGESWEWLIRGDDS